MLLWSAFAASVVLAIATTVLAVLNLGTEPPPGMSFGPKIFELLAPPLMLLFPVVGVVVLVRQPGNAVATVLIAMGLSGELMLVLQQYGVYGSITAPGAVPAARTVLWTASWIWAFPSATLALLPLLFPTGRPISPRWWWLAAAAYAAALLQALPDAISAPLRLPVDSPIALSLPGDLLSGTYAAGSIAWSVVMLASAWSLVLRYRRAAVVERQQLKWFLYASVWFTAVVVVATWTYPDPTIGGISGAIALMSLGLIPASIGIAVLRYRLYDIDIVIERTLVYGSLSAVIAGTYVAFVVTFQTFVGPHVGGSEVGIAGSTLLTLALVQPIRRRIQDTVDRRFYRSRYDAARTLSELTGRLRNEVDLDAVRADLLSAIDHTVRPRHASVWLRDITVGGK